MIINGTEFRTLIDVISSRADENEKGLTYISANQKKKVTYNQLFSTAKKILYNLQNSNVKPKDEVVFQINDTESFVNIFWACILGGMTPVPINVDSTEEHYKRIEGVWRFLNNPYFISDSNSGTIWNNEITSKTLEIEKILDISENEGIIHEGTTEDYIASVIFSSGSTGDPKGAAITHFNFLSNCNAVFENVSWRPELKTLSWSPLTHILGLIPHLAAVVINMDQLWFPTSQFIVNPISWMELANEVRANILFSPNFGFRHFIGKFKPENKNWDLSCVKQIVNGSEPISIELCQSFSSLLKPYNFSPDSMYFVYGITETGVNNVPLMMEPFKWSNLNRHSLSIGNSIEFSDEHSQDNMKIADEGFCIIGNEMRIVDDENVCLKENQYGHIQIRGKSVIPGYYNNTHATDEAFTEDGWFKSGDTGFISNNRITVVGRSKEMIIINGQNIYPHDIEKVAERLEFINPGSIAVTSVKNINRESDEEVLACVVYDGEIKDFIPVAQKLKKEIMVKIGVDLSYILPIKSIPKTSSGKVKRFQIAKDFEDGKMDEVKKAIDSFQRKKADAEPEKSVSDTEKSLVKICNEILHIDNLSVNDNFLDIGINSLMIPQIVEKIKTSLNADIRSTDIFSHVSIRKLAEYIDSQKKVQVPMINLPDKYFDDYKTNLYVNDNIEIDLSEEGINSYAADLGVEPETCLLGVYLYILHMASGQENVDTAVCLTDNKYCKVSLGAAKSSTEELFSEIQKQLNSSQPEYLTQSDFINLKVMDKQKSIVSVFIKNASNSLNDHKKMMVDLSMKVSKKPSGYMLNFNYNVKRIRREAVEEIAYNFNKLLSQILGSES